MTTGFLTLTDLTIAKILADKAQLDTSRITSIIQGDINSPQKQHMAEGVNYYNCVHDILQNRNYYWLDGQKIEDETKSNFTLSHPFHKILVDQKAAYIAGNPVVVSVAEPDVDDPKNPSPQELKAQEETDKFQEKLLDLIDQGFDDLIPDWVIGASNKGIEWVHFYVSPDGELEYCIIPAEQIIPVYDTQYQEELMYVIRFYTYDLINEKGDSEKRYKVEWWSKDGVEYWVQTLSNNFSHDPDYEFNPGPHWFTFNTASPSAKEKNSWGRIPFVPLLNNSQGHTDLRPIKALIDAYDKVKSGWVNDLNDFQEMIYVLKGYQGLQSEAQKGLHELAIFVQNLKTHKAIAVDGDKGGVETLKAEIPVEAKEKFLTITRKEIFYFGEGIDVDNENFNSPSGIALKFLYSSLDLKANRIIRKLKKSLQEFMWFVTEYINRTGNTTYDSTEIVFTMNKAVIFNEKEKIDGLVASEGMLSKQTILENHPYVDDVEQEMGRLDAEEQDRMEKGMVDLANVQPADEDGNPVEANGQPVEPQNPPSAGQGRPVAPVSPVKVGKNGKKAAA